MIVELFAAWFDCDWSEDKRGSCACCREAYHLAFAGLVANLEFCVFKVLICLVFLD